MKALVLRSVEQSFSRLGARGMGIMEGLAVLVFRSVAPIKSAEPATHLSYPFRTVRHVLSLRHDKFPYGGSRMHDRDVATQCQGARLSLSSC